MIRFTALIADDEEVLLQEIKGMLNRLWPELEIIAMAKNGIEAVDMIQRLLPDVAFLDIQMPGMTGVEVARQTAGLTKVVFVTAYDQFAVQAFENETVDYILKPVMEDRLGRTIGRLKHQLIQPGKTLDLEIKIKKLARILEHGSTPDRLRLIKVKTGSELRFIPVPEVIYFKAEDKYTIVQTRDREFLIKTPIKILESQLDPDQFWRVHRSAIVNINKILKIKRSFTNQMLIAFAGLSNTIPVSRSFEHLFRHM